MARACAPSAPSFAERALPELDGLAAKPAPHAGVDKEE
jgi:hypothetical protein